MGHTGWLQDLVKRMKDLESEAGTKKKKGEAGSDSGSSF